MTPRTARRVQPPHLVEDVTVGDAYAVDPKRCPAAAGQYLWRVEAVHLADQVVVMGDGEGYTFTVTAWELIPPPPGLAPARGVGPVDRAATEAWMARDRTGARLVLSGDPGIPYLTLDARDPDRTVRALLDAYDRKWITRHELERVLSTMLETP